MKKFVFLLASIIFLLNGCAVKSALKKDTLYEKTLKYTERSQILNSLETKALIDAIYLNPLYQEKFKNPTFLIGVYNDFDNTLINSEFSLTLNNQAPVKIISSIPSYISYKYFPFYNKWMKYYIVTFKKTSKPYILEYKSKHFGKAKFIFQ